MNDHASDHACDHDCARDERANLLNACGRHGGHGSCGHDRLDRHGDHDHDQLLLPLGQQLVQLSHWMMMR